MVKKTGIIKGVARELGGLAKEAGKQAGTGWGSLISQQLFGTKPKKKYDKTHLHIHRWEGKK